MKTRLLTSLFLILISAGFMRAQTQSLWATTFSSGGTGGGEMFKINSDGSGYTDVYDFIFATGSNPYGNLIQASDGNVYGTTYEGGPSGSCVIFRYNTSTGVYTDVHDFYFVDGYIPYSGLVEVSGKLYGVTFDGGSPGEGVLYSFDISTDTYTDVHNFDATTGSYPWSVPILCSDGKLYGITTSGGSAGGGVIYSFDPTTNSYTDLYSLTAATDGTSAYGSLFQAADGKLYGMTSAGGGNNHGTIFSMDLGTNTFTKLFGFGTTGGYQPMGGFTQGSNGLLYATAYAGGAYNGGAIFSFDLSSNTYMPLHHFNGATDGTSPHGDLMFGSNGLLYGTASGGGASNRGTIYNIDPSNNLFQVMSDFSGSANGAAGPTGGLAVVVTPAGIHDGGLATNDLNLFPNPANDFLQISSNKIVSNATFVLRNSLGQEVLSWNETAIGPGYSKKIDLGNLDNGIYFLEMNADGNKTVKKFVKD
jgi:uncharacterized repeat protein (TIGR03803 family)